jgi:hypothetical protein
MDKELAGAVFRRWDEGLPVAETTLYKAAQALGVDPQAALVEARFQTYLGTYLSKHASLDRAHRILFSAAAGIPLRSMEKSASQGGVSPDELIVYALKDRGWSPYLKGLHKLAVMAMGAPQPGAGGPKPPGQGQGQPPQIKAPGQGPEMTGQMQDPAQQQAMQQALGMQQPPQPGAQVQQPPGFKPSPMAPEQLPPSEEGNLESLIQSQQGAYGQGAQENGGLPPTGMPEPPPAPPSPEERIQQVGPSLDPETVSRYAEQLSRFEQGIQMDISDPKQMVKFVKELQKVDGKKIDQGIKAMGQELEQEQAQELGVDGATPTIDGQSTGPKVLTPKAGPQGAAGPGQAAPTQAPPGGKPPSPEATPGQEAIEKVARAARFLAQQHYR